VFLRLAAIVVVAVTASGCVGCSAPNAPSCEPEGPEACRIDTVNVRGVQRTYVVSQRGSLDCSAGKVPVVVAFHGYADTGAGLRSYLGVEEALNHKALVVYPDGLGQFETGNNTGWDRGVNGEDVAFFDAILAKLSEDECLDTTRVFSVGHSRGGRMVETLSCARPQVHRGYAQIAAGTDPQNNCASAGPAWLTHGVNDGTVPFSEGEADRDRWAARNGCDVPKGQTFPVDACTELTNCAAAEPVVWCPSSATKWNGHAPAEFVPQEMARFLVKFF
jgi:poly(3-hydroxybutyrate) depolymerase